MTTVKAHIQFFVDFVKTDGVDVLVEYPEAVEEFVKGLVLRVNAEALEDASKTEEFHPQLEVRNLQLSKDALIAAMQAAIEKYNTLANSNGEGGVRFQSDTGLIEKLSGELTGSPTQDSEAGEPSCIQIVFKHDEEGNLIRCIEYNFVLHPTDTGTQGYSAYSMGTLPVGKDGSEQIEVQGKYQARLAYDITGLTAGS